MKNLFLGIIIGGILVGTGFWYFNWQPNQSNNSYQNTQGTVESAQSNLGNFAKVGSQAPDFSLEGVDGKTYHLSDYKDKKAVLLVFEFTWCSWCAKERAILEEFRIDHINDLEVISIDIGEDPTLVKNFVREKGMQRLWLLDKDQSISQTYLANGTPYHVLIDKNGKVVSVRPGFANKEDLEGLLTHLEVK